MVKPSTRPYQFQPKALLPILVTLFGMLTLVRALQSANAQLPMQVTLLGIVALVRKLQPLNA